MEKKIHALGQATLGTVIQVLTGHDYLNYHCSKAGISLQKPAASVGRGAKYLFTCKCLALARECLAGLHDLQLSTPPNLAGLVRLTRVSNIAKAMERRTNQSGFEGVRAPNDFTAC